MRSNLNTRSVLNTVRAILLSLLGLFHWKKRRRLTMPPTSGPQTAIQPVAPITLSVNTVDQFIAWANRSNTTDRLRVRDEIVKAREDSKVLAPLFERLEQAGKNDMGTSLIILGIIGELKNPASIGDLEKFIWQPLPDEQIVGHGALGDRDLLEMLQSKAVEGMAYLQTEEADRMTLRVISEHPSGAVRSAAIDAYLFNHEDSNQAKEELIRIVQGGDVLFLDRVRRVRSGNREKFNEGLVRFYQLHPEATPPPPEKAPESARSDRGRVDVPLEPPRRREEKG